MIDATTTAGAAAVDEAADRLIRAAASGNPCPPVRDLIGRDDLVAAYAVQQRLTDARLASGARVVGRKIGLTSVAVQQQLGVDQPDFGILFDDMAFGDGAEVPAGSIANNPSASATMQVERERMLRSMFVMVIS